MGTRGAGGRMGDADLLTVKAAAYEAGVSADTVRRWIDEGKLEAVQVGPTDRIRIEREALARAMRPRPLGTG